MVATSFVSLRAQAGTIFAFNVFFKSTEIERNRDQQWLVYPYLISRISAAKLSFPFFPSTSDNPSPFSAVVSQQRRICNDISIFVVTESMRLLSTEDASALSPMVIHAWTSTSTGPSKGLITWWNLPNIVPLSDAGLQRWPKMAK